MLLIVAAGEQRESVTTAVARARAVAAGGFAVTKSSSCSISSISAAAGSVLHRVAVAAACRGARGAVVVARRRVFLSRRGLCVASAGVVRTLLRRAQCVL